MFTRESNKGKNRYFAKATASRFPCHRVGRSSDRMLLGKADVQTWIAPEDDSALPDPFGTRSHSYDERISGSNADPIFLPAGSYRLVSTLDPTHPFSHSKDPRDPSLQNVSNTDQKTCYTSHFVTRTVQYPQLTNIEAFQNFALDMGKDAQPSVQYIVGEFDNSKLVAVEYQGDRAKLGMFVASRQGVQDWDIIAGNRKYVPFSGEQ